MPVRELRLHRVERCADGEVGEVGKGLAGPLRIYRAGQQANADQEFLLGGEDAQPVEDLFVLHRAVDERRKAADR